MQCHVRDDYSPSIMADLNIKFYDRPGGDAFTLVIFCCWLDTTDSDVTLVLGNVMYLEVALHFL